MSQNDPTVKAHKSAGEVFNELVPLYQAFSRGGVTWDGDTGRKVIGALLDILHLADDSLSAETYKVESAPVVPEALPAGVTAADIAREAIAQYRKEMGANVYAPQSPAESEAVSAYLTARPSPAEEVPAVDYSTQPQKEGTPRTAG